LPRCAFARVIPLGAFSHNGNASLPRRPNIKNFVLHPAFRASGESTCH
jgi:hypothetical protein